MLCHSPVVVKQHVSVIKQSAPAPFPLPCECTHRKDDGSQNPGTAIAAWTQTWAPPLLTLATPFWQTARGFRLLSCTMSVDDSQ